MVGWQEPPGRLSCEVTQVKHKLNSRLLNFLGTIKPVFFMNQFGKSSRQRSFRSCHLCVYRCCSGVTQPDSVPVLLLIMLPFSADSVSLCEGLAHLSSLDSSDSWEARHPEFSLKLLSDRKERRCEYRTLTLQQEISCAPFDASGGIPGSLSWEGDGKAWIYFSASQNHFPSGLTLSWGHTDNI